MSASTEGMGIQPAKLGFLAIYNPSLGATDDTISEQIVYYSDFSSSTFSKRHGHRSSKSGGGSVTISAEERNARLRQIGLSQGMVEFGRSFSGGNAVDTIETEKGRVVLHELEPGWWILASVDLTRQPLSPPTSRHDKSRDRDEPRSEYSSREVKPAALLLQDLLRAHAIFLLHHASFLSALFVRSRRDHFIRIIGRFWDQFLATWNVMLHGNPARAVLGGILLAASGELGVGVGEEERGSGEREVLEGLVGQVVGLVDLVVCKFGGGPNKAANGGASQRANQAALQGRSHLEDWLGTGQEPGPEDGAIFLGVGALSRHSLRNVVSWTEDLYSWGENAYGVRENPASPRQHTRKKRVEIDDSLPEPPAPVLAPKPRAHTKASEASQGPTPPTRLTVSRERNASRSSGTDADGGGIDLLKYLRLGYGTSWSLGPFPSGEQHRDKDGQPRNDRTTRSESVQSNQPSKELRSASRQQVASGGHFLVGLKGDVEEPPSRTGDADQRFDTDAQSGSDSYLRKSLRTLTVEFESQDASRHASKVVQECGSQDTDVMLSPRRDYMGRGPGQSSFDIQDHHKSKKLRVVVYVNQPFIFVLLFELKTDSLEFDQLYRNLHAQLAPLRNPLLASTAYRPEKPELSEKMGQGRQMYELVWDPRSLTVHSTLPSIPEPVGMVASVAGLLQPWTRAEALSTHAQVLSMFVATRQQGGELEQTAKTSRGWWVVWRRVLERDVSGQSGPSSRRPSKFDRSDHSKLPRGCEDDQHEDEDGATASPVTGWSAGIGNCNLVCSKEIFLVKKSGDDHDGAGGRRLFAPSEGSRWTDGASRLAHGIGMDTKRYIEGLLRRQP